MIKSMTGYGRATFTSRKKEALISVEIKSVNQRFRDISVKLPATLNSIEREVRKKVESVAERGKIDICINIDMPADSDTAFEVNLPLARSYASALERLSTTLGLKNGPTLADIVASNDIIKARKLDEDDIDWGDIAIPTGEALQAFDDMRRYEGDNLASDMEERLEIIVQLADMVFARQPEVTRSYLERLKKRIALLTEGAEPDESRLAQEVAIMADKGDITEEVIRLKSHIIQFRELLKAEAGAVGRKLDFLLQEMNREVNTIGSKGNDSEIAKKVVHMKAEIERIKEQVQNIE